MNDNIVQFPSQSNPHISGQCQCLGCQHKWVATAPVGTWEFECPNCKSMKGRTIYEAIQEDSYRWLCKCGNQYFVITPDNIYCPNCGKDQDPT